MFPEAEAGQGCFLWVSLPAEASPYLQRDLNLSGSLSVPGVLLEEIRSRSTWGPRKCSWPEDWREFPTHVSPHRIFYPQDPRTHISEIDAQGWLYKACPSLWKCSVLPWVSQKCRCWAGKQGDWDLPALAYWVCRTSFPDGSLTRGLSSSPCRHLHSLV